MRSVWQAQQTAGWVLMGCGRPLVTGFIKNPVIIGQFCLEQAYNSSCSNIYNNNNNIVII